MLFFVPYPLLIGLGFLCLAGYWLWRETHCLVKVLCFIALGLYGLVVIAGTLFPIPLNPDQWLSRDAHRYILARVNGIPFRYVSFFNARAVWREVLRNLLMLAPLGFGLHFVVFARPRLIVWSTVVGGFAIELAQLLVSLIVGSAYRTVDSTDVILNVVGGLIGVALFRWAATWYMKSVPLQSTQKSAVGSYLHQVVSHYGTTNHRG